MTLDARVHCDCFERGRVRIAPPFPELIVISDEGAPEIDYHYPEQYEAFDEWKMTGMACEHENFALVDHFLGNIGLIGWLRRTIAAKAAESSHGYPILLGRVVYKGMHCGDRIALTEIPSLINELNDLATQDLDGFTAEEEGMFRVFIRQMVELTTAALAVSKPIVF